MIRVCYLCKRVIGEKEPLADRSASHGLCDGCAPVEEARIEREIQNSIPPRRDQDSRTNE